MMSKQKVIVRRVNQQDSHPPPSCVVSDSAKEHAIIKQSWARVLESKTPKRNTLSLFVKTFYELLFEHIPVLKPIFNTPGVQSKYLATLIALTVDERIVTTCKSQRIEREYTFLNETLGIALSTKVIMGRVLLLTLKKLLPFEEYCIQVRITWVNRIARLIFDTLGEDSQQPSTHLESVRTLLRSTEVSNGYFLTSLKQEMPTCPGISDIYHVKYTQSITNDRQNVDGSGVYVLDTNRVVAATTPTKPYSSPRLDAIRRKFSRYTSRASINNQDR